MSKRIGDLPIATSVAETVELEVSLAGSLGSRRVTLKNLLLSMLTIFGVYVTLAGEVGVTNTRFQLGDVRRYGAAANVESATAIQSAVTSLVSVGTTFFGGVVRIHEEYLVGTTIVVPQNKHVSFAGTGRNCALRWSGGNNNKILHFVGGNPGADCKASVEKISFFATAQTGIVAVTSGANTSAFGLSNITVKGCCFQNVDIGLETFSETDEVVFEDNWLLAYYTAGVRASGGTSNSAYHIEKNHFQGGSANSWAVDHTGGSVVRVLGNVIESASKIGGVRLNQVADFEIKSNYFESSGALGAGDGPFADIIDSTNGSIENNHTTGDTGNAVVKIGAGCTNIRFGPNRHGSSGGTPAVFVAIAAGATDIIIIGKQDGTTAPYSGTPSMYFAGDVLFTFKPINTYNGFVTIGAGATATLFTVAATKAYEVFAKNGTDFYIAGAVAARTASEAPQLGRPYNSHANLTLSVSGNNVQATNGTGAPRTIEYSATLVF